MSKRIVLLMGMILVFASIAVMAVIYSPSSIPFPYDPNQVIGVLLGGVTVEAGTYTVIDVNCTDPDGDPFTIVSINPPIGLYVVNIGDVWRIEWTPDALQEGLWYITIEATDIPPSPKQPKSTRGTVIVQVVPTNQAPILHPLKSDIVVIHKWPNDYQKKYQEFRKQRTIIYGPIMMPL